MTYPNGTTAAYTYDSLNRLTLLENRKSGGELISSYYYTLGPAGNRLSVVEQSGRTVNYTYDALYRLTQEAITDPALGNEIISYTYDAFGNRLTKTDASGTISYTYDANDRMLSEAGPTSIATYSYDDNGNTLSKTEGVETTLYSYDFENRLVGVNSAAGATAYGYDPDGIRIAKSTGAVITRYLVDKNRDYAQVLEETDNSSLTVSYVYGDDLISQNRGSSYYYLYDGQMSTRQLTDGFGNVANTYTYDAFGVVLDQAGVVANNYMYTGEQYDPNAGFYYLRARYYNQGVGRYITTDPWQGNIFEPVSLHKYLYANANPLMNLDPSGLMTLQNVMTTISTMGILGRHAILSMTGYITTVSRQLLVGTLQPFMRLVGSLPNYRFVGNFKKLTPFDRFLRFFIAQTKSYPKVNQTWFGKVIIKAFPKINWHQHHVGIQQSWFRVGGPSQWYPGDVLANEGLKRLANAGFNLISIPDGLNQMLGRSASATAGFAVTTYGSIAAGIYYITDEIYDLVYK